MLCKIIPLACIRPRRWPASDTKPTTNETQTRSSSHLKRALLRCLHGGYLGTPNLSDFVYQLRRSVVDRENAGQHRESGPSLHFLIFSTGVKLKWTSVGLQNRGS